jgi:ribosomal protein S18 acetylase RimI-like enzyme
MSLKDRFNHRLERSRAPSLKNWDRRPRADLSVAPAGVAVDCGWGRLLFGQTFTDPESLARALQEEHPGKRDVALYLNDPHVVLSYAPQDLFLDPSHTFRLWFERYQSCARRPKGFHIRLLNSHADAEAIQRLYLAHHMVPPGAEFVWNQRTSKVLSYWIAEDSQDGSLLGVVNGVDHAAAFQDPENGASLWALAVDPQAPYPGIGEALVRQVVEYHQARGRAFLDLSVMHDNSHAIRLYRKLGFERIPAFALKNKNAFNEPLFIGRQPEADLNPYATIIVDEARRRGIGVEVIDAEAGYFALTLGGQRILCRESLSELTSAIAMSRCDDKAITQRVLKRAGLRVPEQIRYQALDQAEAFLSRFGRVVVKPARGEQGAGISVDVRDPETLETAIAAARKVCDVVDPGRIRRGRGSAHRRHRLQGRGRRHPPSGAGGRHRTSQPPRSDPGAQSAPTRGDRRREFDPARCRDRTLCASGRLWHEGHPARGRTAPGAQDRQPAHRRHHPRRHRRSQPGAGRGRLCGGAGARHSGDRAGFPGARRARGRLCHHRSQ